MVIEFRLGWSSTSNITFKGYSDWEEWEPDDDDLTEEDVQIALSEGPLDCLGLELVIQYSGFEWWVETRVVEA